MSAKSKKFCKSLKNKFFKIQSQVNKFLSPLGIIPVIIISLFILLTIVELNTRQFNEQLSIQNIIRILIFDLLALNLLHSYITCSCANPGYITTDFFQVCKTGLKGPDLNQIIEKHNLNLSNIEHNTNESQLTVKEYQDQYLQPLTLQKITYCQKCNIIRPERSHHCFICNKCVSRFDHHCPWINNCVGHQNHKQFMLFISNCVVTIGQYVWIDVRFQQQLFIGVQKGDIDLKFVNTVFKYDYLYSSLIHSMLTGLIVGISVLFYVHVGLILQNRTTFDMAITDRNLEKQSSGQIGNIKDVFGEKLNWQSLFCFKKGISKQESMTKGFIVNTKQQSVMNDEFIMIESDEELEDQY